MVSKGQASLNKSSFFTALGLIGLVQAGKEPNLADLGVGKSTSDVKRNDIATKHHFADIFASFAAQTTR